MTPDSEDRAYAWDEFLASVRGLYVYAVLASIVGATWVSAWGSSIESKMRSTVYYPALPLPARVITARAADAAVTHAPRGGATVANAGDGSE